MYYHLLSSLKRRLVYELRDSFARHPLYSKIVPFIQAKYAFDERPQFGIVVKASGANKVQLSGDNFIGTVQSHVMLCYVGQPTYPLEWVREDAGAVRANQGVFPCPPGIYFIEILTAPTAAQEYGTFIVDPLLTQTDEPVVQFLSGIEREGQLQNPPAEGTVRLWEGGTYLLTEGRDFTVDYTNGKITFLGRYRPNDTVTADYRYAAPSVGPVQFQWDQADTTTLPGVVLAFGKRAKAGDKIAVVVYDHRVDAAQAYGGRHEVSFDFDVIATDPLQMEDIADFALMSLWAEKKALLEDEGITIQDISMGGESEETYDENADTYYHMASLSIQFQADWEVHIPLPTTIVRATPAPRAAESTVGPDRQVGMGDSIQFGEASGLYYATHPVLVGRGPNYERIG